MKTRDNRRIVSHFIKHRVTTRLEISTSTAIDDVSISQKLKILRSVGFIEKKGRIGPPYRSRTTRGAGVPLWGLLEAEPQDYVNAQKRYGQILLATGDPEAVRQSKLPEAIAMSKIYMSDRGLVTIPDRVVIMPILRENGIHVEYDSLVSALRKEGHHW